MSKIGPKEIALKAQREEIAKAKPAKKCTIDHLADGAIPKSFCRTCTPVSKAPETKVVQITELPKAEAKPKPEQKESVVRTKSKSKSTANARKPVNGKGTKLEMIVGLLKRKEGCTTADVLKATGWPSVSMPQQAKAAGLKLKKEKAKGEPTRYHAA